jgi:hypothetical protein
MCESFATVNVRFFADPNIYQTMLDVASGHQIWWKPTQHRYTVVFPFEYASELPTWISQQEYGDMANTMEYSLEWKSRRRLDRETGLNLPFRLQFKEPHFEKNIRYFSSTNL